MDNLPVVALVLALVVNSGALFYWGGSMRQMMRDHERRITNLEKLEGIAA